MHMLQAGIAPVTIKDILGHAHLKTLEAYVQADLEMKRRALEVRLLRSMSGRSSNVTSPISFDGSKSSNTSSWTLCRGESCYGYQRPPRSSSSLKRKNEEENDSNQLSTESDHPQLCTCTSREVYADPTQV